MAEVDDYIAAQPEPARSVLAGLRSRAVELVPDADEGTSYGMASLRYRGRPLVSVMLTKGGYYAIYPFSPDVVAAAVPSLPGYESTKGGIRFTDDRPLPGEVFDRIVLDRRDEIDAAIAKSTKKR